MVQADLPLQLLGEDRLLVVVVDLPGELGDLLGQLVTLALGLEGVREPARDVLDRGQDLAGPGLDRRDHLDDPALHAVQRAGRRLTEVRGEQDQRYGDQQPEDCAAAANLFVMHELGAFGSCSGVPGRWRQRGP